MSPKLREHIKYQKLGIADISFMYNGIIYMDNFLMKYPNLESKILKHEHNHKTKNSILQDYKVDFKSLFTLKEHWILLKH